MNKSHTTPFPTFSAPPFEIPPEVPLSLTVTNALRISGTRVGLESVLSTFQAGYSPDEIVEAFPTLDLAKIDDVIAFYLQNRDQMDAWIKENDAKLRRYLEEIDAKGHAQRLRQNLRAHLAGKTEKGAADASIAHG